MDYSYSSDTCTVMIVDDHTDIRESMRILLEEHGYRVVVAADGHDALRQLCRLKEPPCLILLDLMMPMMDGWQFLDELQRNASFSRIPVVVVSAVNLGADSFSNAIACIRKPVVYPDLLSIMSKVCSIRSHTTSGYSGATNRFTEGTASGEKPQPSISRAEFG